MKKQLLYFNLFLYSLSLFSSEITQSPRGERSQLVEKSALLQNQRITQLEEENAQLKKLAAQNNRNFKTILAGLLALAIDRDTKPKDLEELPKEGTIRNGSIDDLYCQLEQVIAMSHLERSNLTKHYNKAVALAFENATTLKNVMKTKADLKKVEKKLSRASWSGFFLGLGAVASAINPHW